MKRVTEAIFALVVLVVSVSSSFGYTKPLTYDKDSDTIIFKYQFIYSPHAWIIVKAIDLIRHDGYGQEADVAQRYLLPMLEGVTFNDVWGDADLAGASILDYYVPDSPGENFGFGSGFLSWRGLSISPYKNNTASFKSHLLYGYENAAEYAQYRYDYGKRIYLGQWGDGTDRRDMMAGWVVDTFFGQDDPQDGRWAEGTTQLDAETQGIFTTGFGQNQTPASALLDLLQNHSRYQVVFDQSEDALSRIYVPTFEVIDDAPEWLDDHFNNADDVEAYMGYDGHGYAIYANWTMDAVGDCPGGDCAAPMIVRLPVSSKAHAFFQLGWALHLLEDQTTPVHTTNDSLTTFDVHNNVEKMADDVLGQDTQFNGQFVKEALPALSLSDFKGVYPFPPPSCADEAMDPAQFFKDRWYTKSPDGTPTLALQPGEGVAHGYARGSAEITNHFILRDDGYIQCINTDADLNWNSMGFFTALGLDLGVKSAAGLIRQFIEDVDQTPPTVTILQPAATSYPHSGTLTLDYSATDDLTGLKSVTPTLDGATTVAGHGLASGLAIDLLTELTLGNHTFTVTAVDNAGNTASPSVTFSIVVTPDSIKDDVRQFLANGAIKNQGLANSLLAKLNAAAAARAKGNCTAASNIYQAFINELQAQSGKGVDATAAAIMIADAQYLIAHCP